jgi:hypothetical protein
MSEVAGLAEVSEALSIAWKVYEHGWVQERSSSKSAFSTKRIVRPKLKLIECV